MVGTGDLSTLISERSSGRPPSIDQSSSGGRDPHKAAAVDRDLGAREMAREGGDDLAGDARSDERDHAGTMAAQPLIKGPLAQIPIGHWMVGASRTNERRPDDDDCSAAPFQCRRYAQRAHGKRAIEPAASASVIAKDDQFLAQAT